MVKKILVTVSDGINNYLEEDCKKLDYKKAKLVQHLIVEEYKKRNCLDNGKG